MNALKIRFKNDKLFPEYGEIHSEYIRDFEPVELELTDNYMVSEHIFHGTTIDCILQNRGKKVIALNFANANMAGGGYALGGNAQEESLCRASFLYYTIRGAKDYYNANRLRFSPFYTDGMILSENVPDIRTEERRLFSRFPIENGL